MRLRSKRPVKDVLTAVSSGRKLGKLGEVCGLRAQGAPMRSVAHARIRIGTEAEPWPSLDRREDLGSAMDQIFSGALVVTHPAAGS